MTKETIILAGHKYLIPSVVGAGYRAKYARNIMQRAVDSPFVSVLSDSIKKATSLDSGSDFQQRYGALISLYAQLDTYGATLELLNVLLEPCEGSPSVEETYDEMSDEEVAKVTSFFSKSATSKTSADNSKTSSGRASRTPKANR